nr:hypothetical protein [Tessaracoccus coleopterorum]
MEFVGDAEGDGHRLETVGLAGVDGVGAALISPADASGAGRVEDAGQEGRVVDGELHATVDDVGLLDAGRDADDGRGGDVLGESVDCQAARLEALAVLPAFGGDGLAVAEPAAKRGDRPVRRVAFEEVVEPGALRIVVADEVPVGEGPVLLQELDQARPVGVDQLATAERRGVAGRCPRLAVELDHDTCLGPRRRRSAGEVPGSTDCPAAGRSFSI